MSYCLNPDCQKPNRNSAGSKFCQSCGSKLLLGEQFRAITLIGQGGFGRTFLAVDEDKPSKPRCVIKQFFPKTQGTNNLQKAAKLFEEEAARLGSLGKHPQIPDLLAYFVQDGQQYLVQEFIDGHNLAKVLETDGPFSEQQIRDVLNSLLPVVDFIHSHNVIHRDIKPENIIRRPDGQLVLVDFGAAKYATGTALARTGTVIGSAGYAAPEQAGGKAVFASDLYSLGVTCIHLLTQTDPFELYSFSEAVWVWRDYLSTPVSRQLGQVLDKMLAVAISRRYQSAAEVLKDLNYKLTHKTMASARIPVTPATPTRITLDLKPLKRNWSCERTLKSHISSIYSVAISPDGQILASGSADTTLQLWQLSTGRKLHTFRGHTDSVRSVAFSPNGQILASSSWDKTIKVWRLGDRREVGTLGSWFYGHSDAVFAIAFSPNGQILASGSHDKTIKLWRLSKGRELCTFMGDDSIYCVAFHPDGRILASGSSNGTIKLWQLNTGWEVGTLTTGDANSVYSIAFSPDGQILASGSSDGLIKLWQLSTGQELRTLMGDSTSVYCVAISPDGQTLLSGGADKTIKLWQLNTGLKLGILTGHTDSVHSIAISPDQQILVSGSHDKTIKIWC